MTKSKSSVNVVFEDGEYTERTIAMLRLCGLALKASPSIVGSPEFMREFLIIVLNIHTERVLKILGGMFDGNDTPGVAAEKSSKAGEATADFILDIMTKE